MFQNTGLILLYIANVGLQKYASVFLVKGGIDLHDRDETLLVKLSSDRSEIHLHFLLLG